MIVDLDGGPASAPGRDRRRALTLAFSLCLAVGSATVGRDGPAATAPVESPRMLIVSRDTSDVVLFAFPDRLANEPLPNFAYVPVHVRGTQGLAVYAGEIVGRGDTRWIEVRPQPNQIQGWLITWTEAGTAYSLSSDRRTLSDLLHVAESLR